MTASSKDKLRTRVQVIRCSQDWADAMAVKYHYLHRRLHPRAHPFSYQVVLDDRIAGFITYATPHFVRQRDLFGYPGLPTKWQVLMLARFWLRDDCPKHTASCALGRSLRRVPADWLEHHPPVDPSQPYEIEMVLSYADTG